MADFRFGIWTWGRIVKLYSTKFREHKVRTAVSYFMEPFRHSSSDRRGNNKVKFAPPKLQAVHPVVVLQTPEIMVQNPWENPTTKQDREFLTQNTFNLDGTASNRSQTFCIPTKIFRCFLQPTRWIPKDHECLLHTINITISDRVILLQRKVTVAWS